MKQKKRRVLYGVNLGILIIILLATVLVINYLGMYYHQRFDLTANSRYSLSEHTPIVVRSLKKPVHITTFATKKYNNRQ